MQGIDISREFYKSYGLPMLETEFSDFIDRIAVGLAGEGSECLGYDDEISRDHDFDAGFCIWLTEEDNNNFGFKLSRAYSRLPKEFMGLTRQVLSPVGGNRHGVMTISDFYTRHLGAPDAPSTVERWLYTPSSALLAASNGEVFSDPLGKFSEIRERLRSGYPEDIRRKKLAAHTVFMAQSGQYNYTRTLSRGERGAAQLAIFEFTKHAISTIYLLNNKYEPFYKWAYRGLRDLPVLGNIGDSLQFLTETDNTATNAEVKAAMIEDIAALFIEEFKTQGLSEAICGDLEKHAYLIIDGIRDASLRNMHIMDGI